jgi:type VI secretion system secreted protein VgrG
MPIPQKDRLLSLVTPLGADVLVPFGFQGREAMSELFEFTIDMVADQGKLATSPPHGIDPARLLGQKVTLSVKRSAGERRHFNGIVSRLTHGMPYSTGLRAFRATIVPDLWITTRKRNFRVFQDVNLRDIVTKVLSASKLRAVFRAIGGTTVRSYCVQYDETDFNFICRLLEEEGLFFFFRHTSSSHELVIGDASSHYEEAQDREVVFTTATGFNSGALSTWEWNSDIVTGKITQRDYDFEAPSKDLTTTDTTRLTPAILKDIEAYHYPGRYVDKAIGTKLGEARTGAHSAEHTVISASGSAPGFAAGAKAKLTNHPYPNEKGKSFVCIAVDHVARDDSQLGQSSGGGDYSNSFRAIPADVVFRPQRRAARALVQGPLTAIVVGPKGEEIHVDKHGRIRIQFHWDREGAKDGKTTCWVRVAQSLAGKGWGSQFIPRVGMEVVVQFLNGDPDRPLVTGAVYNGENTPPYALPDSKTQSGIKTRSSPKGGGEDFNELRFEDKKGEEEVYLHAQKDFSQVVENDETLDVGNDQKITVKKNRAVTVTEGNETQKIEAGNRTTTLAKGNDTLTLEKGNRQVKLDGPGNHSLTLKSGNAAISLDSGNYSLKAKGGKITLEAAQSIELKVGGSSLKLTPAGIEIKGTLIKANASASVEVKGAMAEVSAKGVLTLKGSITKIN